jgi:cytochrome b subunit of formate dehydrogenase
MRVLDLRHLSLLTLSILLVYTPGVVAQSTSDCLDCHGDRDLTMERGGTEISLFVDGAAFSSSVHADFECVGCHEEYDPYDLPHGQTTMAVACVTCHAEEQFENYENSVHGLANVNGILERGCTECHSPHAINSISGATIQERHEYALETCARCHDDVYQVYMESDHGRAVKAGLAEAPSCIDCHDEHEVAHVHSEESLICSHNQAAMCERCHLDHPDVRTRMGPSGSFITSYETSVHAQAVQAGNEAAATCSDCHGSHEMKKGSDPDSKVHKLAIASTCGTCHGDVAEEYEESAHGKALEGGVLASATCTDCHGEHEIFSHDDKRSPVATLNLSAQVCTPCHSSVRLTKKYGLAGDRFLTFEDSYHGLAGRAGSVEVANCASCHGFHSIKPSSDPTSAIHKDNLAETCGKCHPGANENFARGSVHVIALSGDDDVLYIVASVYVILIVVIVGGMFLHNLLDFIKKGRRQLQYRRGILARPQHAHRLHLRMTLSERIQHGTLVVSFTVLVLTGFALRFPDAWWVVPVRDLSPVMFDLRSIVHRIAGVVMIVAGLFHVYYILFVPRGKQVLRDILPVWKDVTDAIGTIKYNLGLSKERPKPGRFSYAEKAEYWALMWGSLIMGATGFILWFDNTFLGLLTKLGWDIARTVHYYEAWLATLSILIWHFYFVLFNPEIYPINLAFWKGTLTEEEMAEEHPLELERIKQEEREEELETFKAVEGADSK